jgi:hypothetical protein
MALKYASEDLRGNEHIVRAALEKDGRALEFASEDLRNNRLIVRAAYNKNKYSLRYAGRDAVLSIVAGDWTALGWWAV